MRIRLKHERLMALLSESRLSQNHWAMKLGLSRGHWSGIVNGKHVYLSEKTRTRLLEAFGVSFDDLFVVEVGSPETDARVQRALGDRWTIDRQVGQGGMGTVYLARDVKLGRAVAVKVVSAEAVSGIGVERFLKEIRFNARLAHPNILPVHDADEAAGHPFYVMPYVPHGSLRDRLRDRGPLIVEDALPLIRGISAALQHAHDRHVLHCDIKPENILCVGDHAYVADFGIARAIHAEAFEWGRLGGLDWSAGTPAYVSPEQASGESTLSARSDVYSLGCVVFEMLAGRPPFTGTTTMEVVSQRFTTPLPDLKDHAPSVPEPVAAVVARAMSFVPERRYHTAAEFGEALDRAAALGGRAPARPAPGALQRRPFSPMTERLVGTMRRRGEMVGAWMGDLRYAARSLRRLPGFALAAIVTLALGIGANTAIVSVLHGVLLRPLPFGAPERLVEIGGGGAASAPNFLDLRHGLTTFEDIVASSLPVAMNLSGAQQPDRVTGAWVSWGFFPLFRATPTLGRTFTTHDDRAGAERVVILSEGLWRSRFGMDSTIIGRTVTLDGRAATVVGIGPRNFRFAGNVDLWLPFQWDASNPPGRANRMLLIYGRLDQGVDRATADAELQGQFARLIQAYPDANDGWRIWSTQLHVAVVGDVRAPLWILAGAACLVLLIACVNVTNLLLSRAEARRREMALRVALGASRGRMVGLFISEGVVLSGIGGVLGTVGAYLAVNLMVRAYGDFIPRSDEIGVNAVVLMTTAGASIVVGVAVGAVAALRRDGWGVGGARGAGSVLRSGSRVGGASRQTVRAVLVVAQLAMALMLVAGAGLLIRSFLRIQQVDLGMRGHDVTTASVSLPFSGRYRDRVTADRLVRELIDEVARLPGVASVGAVNKLPFEPTPMNVTWVHPVGDPDNRTQWVEFRAVNEGYFAALGIPFIRGHAFSDRSEQNGDRPVVINAELAGRLFAGRDPLGERLGGWGGEGTIVGVVGDTKEFGPDRPTPPMMFWPLSSVPTRATSLLIHTSGNAADVIRGVRSALSRLDATLPLYGVARIEDLIAASVGDRRFQLTLLSVFAGLALALGAVGIYGLIAYLVEQQRREIGVRMALGAKATNVLRLILGRMGRLVLAGVVIGGAGSIGAARLMDSLVFEIQPTDPVTLLTVTVVLAAVALFAGYVPARRATLIAPSVVLREE